MKKIDITDTEMQPLEIKTKEGATEKQDHSALEAGTRINGEQIFYFYESCYYLSLKGFKQDDSKNIVSLYYKDC